MYPECFSLGTTDTIHQKVYRIEFETEGLSDIP